jgi:hypothetical protein
LSKLTTGATVSTAALSSPFADEVGDSRADGGEQEDTADDRRDDQRLRPAGVLDAKSPASCGEIVLGDLLTGFVSELVTDSAGLLELANGGVRLLGAHREGAELVTGPRLAGFVAQRERSPERDADPLDEGDPAAEESEGAREGAGQAEGVGRPLLAVEALERGHQRVGLPGGAGAVDAPLGVTRETSSACSTFPVTLSVSTSVSSAVRALVGGGWLRASASSPGFSPAATVARSARVPSGAPISKMKRPICVRLVTLTAKPLP